MGSFIALFQNVLKITCIWGGRCYKKGALLLTYILCPFEYIKGVFAQSAQIKIRISKKVTRPRQLSISHISKKVMGGFYFMYLWFWLCRTRKVTMAL